MDMTSDPNSLGEINHSHLYTLLVQRQIKRLCVFAVGNSPWQDPSSVTAKSALARNVALVIISLVIVIAAAFSILLTPPFSPSSTTVSSVPENSSNSTANSNQSPTTTTATVTSTVTELITRMSVQGVQAFSFQR